MWKYFNISSTMDAFGLNALMIISFSLLNRVYACDQLHVAGCIVQKASIARESHNFRIGLAISDVVSRSVCAEPLEV